MWIWYDVVCLFRLALLTSWEAAHTCKSQWHRHISEALRWLERWQRMRPPTRPLCLSLSLFLSIFLSFFFLSLSLSLSLSLCVWVAHAPRIWGQPASPRESVAEFKCHVFFSNEQHAWCIARMTDERIPISRASCSCNILTCHLWGPLLRYVKLPFPWVCVCICMHVCLCLHVVCLFVCLYIYIYICCEVIIWSKFEGFWKLLSGPSWGFGLLSGPSLCFSPIKTVVVKRCVLHTQLSFCVFFFCPQFSGNFLKIALFQIWGCNYLGFPIWPVF